MGSINSLDKDKCIGGSFTGRVMFKNWQQIGSMGMLDFMVSNGWQAWMM
jgi:hypothetical protein